MHHAYLLAGGSAEAEKFLHSFWKERGVELQGSPDFFLWKIPVFGIDEARELKAQAVRKSFGGQKVFFISPERITGEAQNALLKTFEDPGPDTHFFLAVREEALILPTLRSRMQIVRTLRSDLNSAQGQTLESGAQNFLKLSLKERLVFAKKFADDEKNLSVFLDEILRISRSKEVYDVRKFSDDRGAAPRLILEHLALVL